MQLPDARPSSAPPNTPNRTERPRHRIAPDPERSSVGRRAAACKRIEVGVSERLLSQRNQTVLVHRIAPDLSPTIAMPDPNLCGCTGPCDSAAYTSSRWSVHSRCQRGASASKWRRTATRSQSAGSDRAQRQKIPPRSTGLRSHSGLIRPLKRLSKCATCSRACTACPTAVHLVHRDFGGGAVLRGGVGAEDGPDERIEDARESSSTGRTTPPGVAASRASSMRSSGPSSAPTPPRGRMSPLWERSPVDRGGVSLLLLGQRGHGVPAE
jgi:hypothetical protein